MIAGDVITAGDWLALYAMDAGLFGLIVILSGLYLASKWRK